MKKPQSLGEKKRALLDILLKEEGLQKTRGPVLEKRAPGNPVPLTFAQERIWFLDQYDPGNPVYNISVSVTLDGPLDQVAFRRSTDVILKRHEVFSSSFISTDTAPLQVQLDSFSTELPQEDLTSLTSPEKDQQIQDLLQKLAATPFDLAGGALFRHHLLRLSETSHVYVMVMHHIISDAASFGIFFRELSGAYNDLLEDKSPELPSLNVQYSDYSIWDRAQYQSQGMSLQIDFWKKKLAGPLPVLQLPIDKARPVERTYPGAIFRRKLPRAHCSSFKALARNQQTTFYMAYLAAFAILLRRYSGQDDIIIGSPVSRRDHSDIQSIIGYFQNTLALRNPVDPASSFTALLGQVKQTVIEAIGNQSLSFEKLVELLQPDRDPGYNPIFQVAFVFNNISDQQVWQEALQLQGLTCEAALIFNDTAKFDLTFGIDEGDEADTVSVEYNTDLFLPQTIEQLFSHYQVLISQIVETPEKPVSNLKLMTHTEENRILTQWNETFADYPDTLALTTLFERQAQLTPNAVAVQSADLGISYRELDKKANKLANYLQQLGVGPGTYIGILTDRSPDMLVGLMGIFKTGAAYVPLDPAYPVERLRFMIEDSGLALLISQAALETTIQAAAEANAVQTVYLDSDWSRIEHESDGPPPVIPTADNTAYVIYTSGSTGKPKGVRIPHRALVNFLCSMRKKPGISASDVLFSVTTLSFDIAALELFLPLICGARVVIAGKETVVDANALAERLGSSGATIMQATPATWRMLLESGWQGSRTLKILSGGEALPREMANQLLPRCAELWNMYGPTETTIWSSVGKIVDDQGPVLIGRPIDNTQMYILDRQLQPVPCGIPGELYIGGDGLASGYLNRPELSAERFITDPFMPGADRRIYRTGDLARYVADGRIECLGRIDNQIKLRGFRIELGEIESQLNAHPAVSQAVVIDRAFENDIRLVAYFVPAGAQNCDKADLQQHLRDYLPEYMIPSYFVELDRIPLTPNGKTDRKALPAPLADTASDSFEAPEKPIAQLIAAIWETVLGVKRVGMRDNFFDLGGHSLLATRVVSHISRALAADIPLAQFFKDPTVAGLAMAVKLKRGDKSTARLQPILRAEGAGPFPLSFSQQRLWFLEHMGNMEGVYNVPAIYQIRGEVDRQILEESLQAVIARHDSLRTNISTLDGEPYQSSLEKISVPLVIRDLSGLPRQEQSGQLNQLIREAAVQPFDLGEGPLIRVYLYCLDATRQILLILTHHIVSDGQSLIILLQELGRIYAAGKNGGSHHLPELAVQYGDFSLWQRTQSYEMQLNQQLNYWQQQLRDLPVLNLPGDYARPAIQTFYGAYRSLRLPESLGDDLSKLSRKEGVTLFMTLLAAFQLLLSHYSGQEDVVVGSPVSGRNRSEIEPLIGFFVNTLVLRGDLSGRPTFIELLKRTCETCLNGYDNQDVTFEKLVETLRPERDLSRNPLFQVMFMLQHIPVSEQQFADIAVSTYQMELPMTKFDLSVSVLETDGTLDVYFEYNRDLFAAETIDRMLGQYQTLLQGIVENPRHCIDDIPWIEDRAQLIEGWNQTESDYPGKQCFIHLFDAQVEKTPDRIAISFRDRSLTYRELERQANQLAHYLRKLDPGPGALIGIYLERAPEMLIGLLAAMKAGYGYVPLDPIYPQQRIRFMLDDAGIKLLICQQSLEKDLTNFAGDIIRLDVDRSKIEQEADSRCEVLVSPENIAYTIYTSGSTGKPKGVQIPQRALLNFLLSMQSEPGISQQDILLSVTTLSFDIAALELYLPLLCGAQVHIADQESLSDPRRLAGLIEASGATIMQATPATWRLLIDDGWSGSPALKVLSGGEAIPADLAKQLLQRCGELWNMYGPTETTIWSSIAKLADDGGPVTIGRPIANTQMYILDRQLRPLPPGIPGELYIGGAGIANGYLNRPELTAGLFIDHPFRNGSGQRVYRTGDLARFLADGRIECLGRMDNQVKIRGFRIELGEIESVLKEHPVVEQAVVVDREFMAGDVRLTAYIVNNYEGDYRVSELRRFLREQLPDYMVPAHFIQIESIPLTPNGKIDRNALPAPDGSGNDNRYLAPETPSEQLIAGIWRELLSTERIGVHDNFFDLGGHSLLAIKMLSRIEKNTGHLFTPRDVLVQTLGQLATHCKPQNGQAADARPAEGTQGGSLLRRLKQSLLGD